MISFTDTANHELTRVVDFLQSCSTVTIQSPCIVSKNFLGRTKSKEQKLGTTIKSIRASYYR